MSEDPYVYPGTKVLRNKLDLRDPATLAALERRMVAQRIMEGVPRGAFDLEHLQSVHRHLFQDVYEWAGEIRVTELSKGGQQFLLRRFIESGVADVARRIAEAKSFKGLSLPGFAREAGRVIGDINYIHPFREGNGRTQLQILRQLAEVAGWSFVVRRIDPAAWLQASRRSHGGDYAAMTDCIRGALDRGA